MPIFPKHRRKIGFPAPYLLHQNQPLKKWGFSMKNCTTISATLTGQDVFGKMGIRLFTFLTRKFFTTTDRHPEEDWASWNLSLTAQPDGTLKTPFSILANMGFEYQGQIINPFYQFSGADFSQIRDASLQM